MSFFNPFLPVCILFVAAGARAAGMDNPTWTSQEHRCSITFPGKEWHPQDPAKANLPANFLILYVNGEQSKSISVGVMGADGVETIDRDGFEKGFIAASGAKKLTARDMDLEGRTAYRFVGQVPSDKGAVSCLAVTLVSHDKVYVIVANSLLSEIDTDPEVNSVINSFHLFDPPDDKRVEKIAGLTGKIFGGAIGGAVGAAIGVFFLTRLRRKRAASAGSNGLREF